MNDETAWMTLWAKIDARRVNLGMSLSDMYANTGSSETTFGNMRRRGQPILTPEKLRRIEIALHWREGSVLKVIDGGEPLPLPAGEMNTSEPTDYEERISALEAELAEYRQFFRRVSDQFGE